MKILAKNLRQGEVKVLVENPDDLWFLNNIIDPGDRISGKTLRKIKATEEAKAERKPIFLALTVEKLEYTPQELRTAGKITEGPEDVPRGSYHTFAITPGTRLTITKPEWLSYQLDYLTEASEITPPKIVICVFDREEALFAKLTREGYELLSTLKGKVAKKRVEEKVKETFHDDIIAKLEDYDKRFGLDKIILASPAFWKEELYKVLKNPELRKKIILATCSGADETAIAEVLKRKETQQALQQERISKEMALVDNLMVAIAKNDKAAYGFDDVKNAAEAGAIEHLLVADSLIQELREKGAFKELDAIMKQADRAKGRVWIISTEHEGGKKLKGLGGIAATLRYSLH